MKLRNGSFALAALSLAALGLSVAAARTPHSTVSEAAISGEDYPRTLSQFGFFADGPGQVPADGVTPYRLNMPLWSDGADKLRFVYVPAGQAATPNGDGLLQFPVGSALIKTFAFGEGAERRLIETRVLLHRADGWVALPYVWDEDQSEARLALAGARREVVTLDGQAISYRVPNKNQCKTCHSKDDALLPIGPQARNLSPAWLDAFHQAGRLGAVPQVARRVPLWEDRGTVPVAQAARGYLDINCAHCHRPGGSASNSGLDLRWEQDDPVKIGIGKTPVAAGRGSGGHLVSIAPGQPDASIMVHRMGSVEPGVAMPELGRASVDREGLALVRAWITGL